MNPDGPATSSYRLSRARSSTRPSPNVPTNFVGTPGGEYYTRNQLQADALVMISQDSLEDKTTTGAGGGFGGTVFVDLERANGSGGELGAELQYGPRVGPNVLEEILCGGSVQLVGLENGKPIITSQSASAIPPSVRKFVAWRDKGAPYRDAPAAIGSRSIT